MKLEEERLAHIVRELERQFRRALEKQLEQHGVAFGHWVFLRLLWQEEGVSQRDLAARAGLTAATTHTAIARMAELGLVELVVPKQHKTRRVVHLSARGRELRAVLEPLAVQTNDRATEGIPAPDLDVCRRTLLRLIGNLSGCPSGHVDS